MPRYHMQRTEREITDPAAIETILKEGIYATLAMARGSEPYLVTMNYGYDPDERALHFHCANEGLKLAFLRENPVVCGTVVNDRGYLDGKCSHAFSSAVFWGHVEFIEDEAGKREALACAIDHLEADAEEMRRRLLAPARTFEGVTLFRVVIDEITGKAGN